MDIPAKVKEFREAKGLNVTELAKASSISQPYLRQIELGIKKNPSATVLKKLAQALGVTVTDIIGMPVEIPYATLREAPKSLQEFAKKRKKRLNLHQEDIEMLKGIHFRGKQPKTMGDWELIFLFLKRLLD